MILEFGINFGNSNLTDYAIGGPSLDLVLASFRIKNAELCEEEEVYSYSIYTGMYGYGLVNSLGKSNISYPGEYRWITDKNYVWAARYGNNLVFANCGLSWQCTASGIQPKC